MAALISARTGALFGFRIADDDGTVRTATVCPQTGDPSGPWKVGRIVERADGRKLEPPEFFATHRKLDEIDAGRWYLELLLEDQYCRECRVGAEPAVCPQRLSLCARRHGDRYR